MRRTYTTRRGSDEEWTEYIQRLETARLRAIGEHKQQSADALDEVAEYTDDPHLRVAARAERAAAHEFLQAVEDMEGGAED